MGDKKTNEDKKLLKDPNRLGQRAKKVLKYFTGIYNEKDKMKK